MLRIVEDTVYAGVFGRLEGFARGTALSVYQDAEGAEQILAFAPEGAPEGLLYGKLPDAAVPPPSIGEFTWHLDTTEVTDIWLALTWAST
jgi:hypothetical protein